MNNQLTRERGRYRRHVHHSPLSRQRLAVAPRLLAGWPRMHIAEARLPLHLFRFSDFVSPGVAPVRAHARTAATTG